MTEPAITCRGLSKCYGEKTVLRALDLTLPTGSVIGLLGKNGSGKTTLIKAILGLIRPSAGTITTLGHDAWDLPAEAKACLGYVPQVIALYSWMKVRHMLDYTASFYPRWNHDLIRDLLTRWELSPEAVIGPLSAGQLQKLAILLAIGHEPDLLVLDEPAAALDPIARRAFLATLLEIIGDSRDGTGRRTILFSTHITSDLERVADRVAILKDGVIVYHDELDALKDRVKRLHIHAAGPLPASLSIPGTLDEQVQGPDARICLAQTTPELVARLERDLSATVTVEDLNLDEIFLEFHHA